MSHYNEDTKLWEGDPPVDKPQVWDELSGTWSSVDVVAEVTASPKAKKKSKKKK